MSYHVKKSKKDPCRAECDFDVNVDLDVRPRVDCKPLYRRGTEFDIELDFDIKPHCRVYPKKKKHDGCEDKCKCEFTVKVDFDCHPRLKCHPCNRASADYNVKVDMDFETNCKPIKKDSCSSSSSSSSSSFCSSSSSSSSSSCDVCPKEAKKKYQKKDSYSYEHYDWDEKKDYWN